MDTKRLFVLLLLGLFMISMVSAMEFDNVKSYDSVAREVTIKNAYGLGDTIGKARLNTPLNVKVGAGYQKVAEFDITSYQDYNDILKQFTFADMKSGKTISREIDIKYKGYETVEVNDYKQICSISKVAKLSINGTAKQVCNQVVVGSHKETKEIWTLKPTTNLLKDESITIGIFTEVEIGDYVDWVPTIYGVEVEEWATWTADLNTDIVSYWKLNLSSSNQIDSVLSNDGTVTSATYTASGKISGAYSFDGTNDFVRVSDDNTLDITEAITLSAWIKLSTTSPTSEQIIISKNYGGTAPYELVISASGRNAGIQINNVGWKNALSSATLSTDVWYHIVGTYDKTNLKVYINGILNGTTAETGSLSSNSLPMSIGARSDWDSGASQNGFFKGYIDEVGIWDSALTQSEITQLYNGGTGMTYTTVFYYPPQITLNFPTANANYSSPQTITFNYTASDDVNLSDVKLYVNDVLNQTNAIGLNNTDYLFDLDLGDGEFEVYAIATDNESLTSQSSSITIVIDSTAPTLTDALGLDDIVTLTLPINSSWNYTATDTHIDQCYYNTTANATQTVIICNSSINTTWTTGGNKTVTYCANDTFGFKSCQTDYVYVYYVEDAQAENEDPTVEGLTVTWNLSVDMTNIPTTTAILVINGTSYAPTTTLSDANGYYFEVVKQIPDTWGNTTGNLLNWSWNYTIDGVIADQQMDQENITVYELAVDNCSVYSDVILDMFLYDEETTAEVNGSAGANVEIDLTITSKANSSITLDYFNAWEDESNPQVCIPANVLNETEYQIDFTIGFDSLDHVWEFYYLDNGTLDATKIFDVQTTTPLYLMDLLTVDSTSFLFNYYGSDGLPVDDVVVHVYRRYIGEGAFREVERAKADNNGDTIVHLVEEDVIYYFVISQYGEILFTSSQYTALCQATPCTIQIEASSGSAQFPTDWSLVDGGAYTISSSSTTRQVALDYASDEATTYNLTVYRYESDGSYSAINTSSSTGTAGTILMTVPQSAGNISFFASVDKDDVFVNSEWVDFNGKASDRFGVTLSLFIATLLILCLGLMAVSEGGVTIFWVVLGVVLSGFLGLINTDVGSGVAKYSMVIFLISAGALLIWKLTGGRK